jgi:sugar phosphate permease
MKVFRATNNVLLLLCVMYFITYVDRVNMNTAIVVIREEMSLTTFQVGLLASAFAYPYLIFQVIGGWVGDRFGPRNVLFVSGLIWAGATILTGFAWGLTSLFVMRLLLGLGEGATFPTATRAMRNWMSPKDFGFGQGITHSFARFGNFVTPPLVAMLILAVSWRGAFVVLGLVSLVWVVVWYWYFRDDPKEHKGITPEELARLPAAGPKGARAKVPWGPLVRRIAPVTLTYFCYGWCLWTYLNWIPLYFRNQHGLELTDAAIFSAGVFFGGVVGDTVGGLLSDGILHRTKNIRFARLSITVIGLLGAFLSLVPLLFTRDVFTAAFCLSSGFFFAELVIGPMWAIPMDIAPKYAGTASGLMNTGSAFAAIVSPLVVGYLIDVTGNWELAFYVLMGVLTFGAVAAFAMHPEIPFEEPEAQPVAAPAQLPAQ